MKLLVNDGWVGVLYENGAFARLLSAGKYVLPTWPWSPEHKVVMIDLRERSTTIKNQEILTADKVSVRVSLLIYFKVTDPKDERASEAKLIDARSRAEVAQLEARAQLAALEERLKADEKQVKLLAENPLLLRVKELKVLREIGLKGNNPFYIGLDKLTSKARD